MTTIERLRRKGKRMDAWWGHIASAIIGAILSAVTTITAAYYRWRGSVEEADADQSTQALVSATELHRLTTEAGREIRDELRSDLQRLEDKLDDAHGHADRLRDELVEQRAETRRLEDEIDDLKAANREYRAELNELRRERDDLMRRLEDISEVTEDE